MKTSKNLNANVMRKIDDHIPNFYITKKCPFERVTNILSEEVKDWDAHTPVLIDAPVGLGKTTLVKEVIYPLAKSRQQNIVIVGNRIALSLQQKIAFLKKANSKYLRILSEEGIAEQKVFDDLAILTYQSLPQFIKDMEKNSETKKWLENVGFVIADEIHFFTSDASFNYKCDLILETLIAKFSKAVRVYMTATPWDIIYPLSEAEERFYTNMSEDVLCQSNHIFQLPRRGLLYHFERDYSQYTLCFFEDINEITEKIKSDKETKWLIFIDKKNRLNDITSDLNDKPIYLDASQKDSDDFKKLIRSEQFDGQVLVSTSVLDCGVNIIDGQLKNIVIFSDDRTAIMQMAGRKRLQENDNVTLWIHIPSNKSIASRCNNYNVFLEFEDEYANRVEQLELAPKKPYQAFHDLTTKIWNHPRAELRLLFQVSGNRIYKNRLAFFKMRRKVDFYNKILGGQTTFQHEVENWFEKPHADCHSALEALDLFYEEHRKQLLDEQEQVTLRGIIIATHKEAGKTQSRTDRNDTLGVNALNNLLTEIKSSYHIERINTQFWGLFKKQ
jgi:hypothetical protein